MFERFSRDARRTVVGAVEEARRRGDRRVGTDHLLLGLLHDEVMARVVGTTLDAARKADEALDTSALAAIGVDASAGPVGWAPISRIRRAPFSSGARDVMRAMLAHATAEKARAIETRHLLMALLERDSPDPASTLLVALGIDRAAVRAALATRDAA